MPLINSFQTHWQQSTIDNRQQQILEHTTYMINKLLMSSMALGSNFLL